MDQYVTLFHGSGSKSGQALLEKLFLKHFDSPVLHAQTDGAVLPSLNGRLVTSTDSHVVTPLFFPGGDIGKLAVCGTVNDLCAMGAKPLYLTIAFIIEEGFSTALLEQIVISMANTARDAGVSIVAGDTKVVEKGKADQIFITTSGIGVIENTAIDLRPERVRAGDHVIISGTIGDHGACILSARESLSFSTVLGSDCAPLNALVQAALNKFPDLHCLRDPTRGGLISSLYEIAERAGIAFRLDEPQLPVTPATAGLCELLGLEPWHLANEGAMVLICAAEDSEGLLALLQQHPQGRNARRIGEVSESASPRVFMQTAYGTDRLLSWPSHDPLPRIC